MDNSEVYLPFKGKDFVSNISTEHLLVGTIIRLLLILYGLAHDALFNVKYTDVDYIVFTDGARYLWEGRSPFFRHGYRYTPLLAYIVLPNVFGNVFIIYGKLLFSAFDLLTAYLIYKILTHPKIKLEPEDARTYGCLWLYNPLPLIVSTRGSSDSLITFLVLLVVYLILQKKYTYAGLMFGLAVHCKLYPVIYMGSFYIFLSGSKIKSVWSCQVWFPIKLKKLNFVFATVTSFAFFTYFAYVKFGTLYLDEAWLYHFHRKDDQHNFSPYFYVHRLTIDSYKQKVVGYMAFVPQLAVILYFSLKHCVNRKGKNFPNLFYVLFAQTYLFVTLNKVCTSQYFLWYLCLFPLIAPFLRIEFGSLIKMLSIWLLGQGLWLLPAYLYEFQRWKCLRWVWMASILFLIINVILMIVISRTYKFKVKKRDKKS